MLRRVSGVGVKLQNVFPNIILWHCYNYRLKLAVSDTLKEVYGTNHFQSFIEKLYVLYHQSPKNRNELSICATSLEQKLLNIGKIFTIRLVASSEKTLKAVFNNYTSLYNHFFNASNDSQRESKEKAKYNGLKNILTSVEFVNNLGIMYDALSELADLSLQLQNRNISLSVANNYIQRAICVFDSMSEHYGPKTEEVVDAYSKLMFKDVPNNRSVPKINSGQFFKSLANNMRSRLFTFQASHSTTAGNVFKEKYDELHKDLDVLNIQNWPDKHDIQYGDKNVRRLVKKFQVDETSTIRGFREFKDTQKLSLSHSLRPLIVAINTVAISSECERSFNTMNNTVTWKRNGLTPKNISSLLLIQCVGPPTNSFIPSSYVKSWILSGKRDTEENCCPKRIKLEDKKEHTYDKLWNCLNK